VSQRPAHEVPGTHCPAAEQTSPPEQSPQEPKHPSDPQVRPVQSGTHVQTLEVSHTG